MSLATAITATTTHELKLEPQIRRKLLAAMRNIVDLRARIKELEREKAAESAKIEGIQTELEESSIEIDGYKSTLVAGGVSRSFDEKKFIALGGDIDIYRAALVEKPKKGYIKISAPNDREDD